ncbi:hypothetical protein ACTXT7_017315 [Hymenolepis weldensis]
MPDNGKVRPLLRMLEKAENEKLKGFIHLRSSELRRPAQSLYVLRVNGLVPQTKSSIAHQLTALPHLISLHPLNPDCSCSVLTSPPSSSFQLLLLPPIPFH